MPEWVLPVMGVLGAGVGAYAAIRADLARLQEVATQAREPAAVAHRRIDELRTFQGTAKP